ncbi:MAG: 50S ribosomal protein L25 [Planctomycetes bacterium]|nr:50S ribosomal protein L25 [Planctomycetota bacterium]
MQTHELKADRREGVGSRSSRGLRNDGRIPAVLCGKGTESLALHVSAKDFEDLRKKRARIVMLQLDGMSNAAVVHEVAWDTMSQEPLHVDFQRINMNEKIEIEVSIKVRGPSKGEAAGGILLVQSDAVKVRCLPLETPESIEVDVRALDLHGTVHIRDLKLPPGVEAAEEASHLVLSIVEKVETAAPVAVEAAATTAEPEVIAKAPKKDEAGDAPAAAPAKDAKKPEKK